jgi:hypothetical protein
MFLSGQLSRHRHVSSSLLVRKEAGKKLYAIEMVLNKPRMKANSGLRDSQRFISFIEATAGSLVTCSRRRSKCK